MASGKLTPRQKMINMMYLVLTALLALNVSKEILNAFVIVNNGLEKTNGNFAAKNDITYNQFNLALLNDEVKVRPFYEKAMNAKRISKEMFDYLANLKKEIIKEIEQTDTIHNIAYMDGKDNYDVPTHFLMGEATDKAEPGTKAFDLKDRINKFRADMLSLVPEKVRSGLNIGLLTNDEYSVVEEKVISWESNNFYHNVAAAVITIFSKIQNDVKNAEADVINALYKQIDVASFKFDTVAAKVIASSNYVLTGDEYKADIFLAAFSTTSNPVVVLGDVDTVKNVINGAQDSSSVKVHRGLGTYTVRAESEGLKKWAGIVKVKNPADNSIIRYPFKAEYMVARPAAVVSPTKMNVLYIGVDNPVEVSCPGVALENLRPSFAGNGSMSGGKGKYTVNVRGGIEATINVGASLGSGNKNMGSFKFRVKPVPDPVAQFAGKEATDVITKSQLVSAAGVIAVMKNFDFDLKFQVISFDVSMNIGGIEVSESTFGPALSGKQLDLLKRVKPGNKVYIENIKAKGPDGSIRKLGSVNLKVIG